MAATETLRFAASFKKVPGTLSLTATHIAWGPTAVGKMDRQQQALPRVSNMMASKAESANVSLKLLFKDNVPEGGLTFTFTAETKRDDRQKVQDTLIPFVAQNKAAGGVATPGAAPASTPGAGTPAGVVAAVAAANASSAAPSSAGVSTPGTPSGSTLVRKRKADDMDSKERNRVNALRRRVLLKNPTLKLLHKELVMAKQISEDEFWDGREALIKAEELAYAQRPGRPSRLLDDRFDLTGGKKDSGKIVGGTGVGVKKAESGPVVLNITKELTREIFEEFPVVQDAYAKNVPRVSETEFWKRYFTSTLWERHRASVRKSATDEGSRKKDDIFDVYLEDPDWDVQPRKEITENVATFLNLAATEEDHGESTTIRDVTMQAGKERSSLPLIRRFNDHSEKLLQAGRKDQDKGTSATVLDDRHIYEEIEYADLRAPAAPASIPLDVQDTSDDKKADGARGILPGRTDAELLELADAQAAEVADWAVDFAHVCMPNPANPAHEATPEQAAQYEKFVFQRDAQAVAMRVVRDMHVASNAEAAEYATLPSQILEQMRSCHNAATEFLRQYWSAVLPPQPGSLGAGSAAHAPAARAARAAKMARYLEGTEGKVNAIVTLAEMERCDPERVRAALAPTLSAVGVALQREKIRVGAPVKV